MGATTSYVDHHAGLPDCLSKDRENSCYDNDAHIARKCAMAFVVILAPTGALRSWKKTAGIRSDSLDTARHLNTNVKAINKSSLGNSGFLFPPSALFLITIRITIGQPVSTSLLLAKNARETNFSA